MQAGEFLNEHNTQIINVNTISQNSVLYDCRSFERDTWFEIIERENQKRFYLKIYLRNEHKLINGTKSIIYTPSGNHIYVYEEHIVGNDKKSITTSNKNFLRFLLFSDISFLTIMKPNIITTLVKELHTYKKDYKYNTIISGTHLYISMTETYFGIRIKTKEERVYQYGFTFYNNNEEAYNNGNEKISLNKFENLLKQF